jgi:diguanylate cyclase (GGDEF)-like protein
MKSACALAAIVIQGLAAVALAATPAPLTTLRSVSALSREDADRGLSASVEATVTFYEKSNGSQTLFVQDDGIGLYIAQKFPADLLQGDRIRIHGKTEGSFRPIILADGITLLHHGAPPEPTPTTFDQLIHGKNDSLLVSMHGVIHAADPDPNSDSHTAVLQLLTDGGLISTWVKDAGQEELADLLDAEVQLIGVAGGVFDGKYQEHGITLHLDSPRMIKVLHRAATNPWSLPLTPMDRVMAGYHVNDRTERVRVHGAITYYQPGESVVLQNGDKSIWVSTVTRAPLEIGDVVDATGFPESHNGFLAISQGEVKGSNVHEVISPLQTNRRELSTSRHIIDLVSVEGEIVMQARGATQDQYELTADGQLFSAVFRHPLGSTTVLPMKQVPLGSRVRVTGICITEDSNPFANNVSFDILMRSFDDITVVAEPSLLNVTNLAVIALVLLLFATAASAWGWTLKSKVREQTDALARRIEAEAAVERRTMKLEQRRSRILEDINTSRPLAEIIEQITDMVSFWLDGAPCWCEIADGATLGVPTHQGSAMRLARQPIPSRTGDTLGILFAGISGAAQLDPGTSEALIMGARLAALAMETRRLYSDLTHRSEFDLLTDIHNRFSLDRQLEAQIIEARQRKSVFGIIYIDLDKFKQVNDRYGHHIGDLYLQESALRMKRQLRGGDMLARLGGDEFAALLTSIRGRADIDEIAHRLERCFDPPFNLEGYELRGAASIGTALFPDDGYTKDSLLNAADASMYAIKNSRRAAGEMPKPLPSQEAAASRR